MISLGGVRQHRDERVTRRRNPATAELVEQRAQFIEVEGARQREKPFHFSSEPARFYRRGIGAKRAQRSLGGSVFDEDVFVQVTREDTLEFGKGG